MKRRDLNNLILEAYAEVISELNEAPTGVHYIKVESTELMEALGILEEAFADTPEIKFELNDPDTIYVHNADNADMHDAVEELQQNGIIVDETSIDSELEVDELLNESLLDELEEAEGDEDAGAPEGQDTPDTNPGKEAELPDATDTIINRFPILKQALVKLHTEEFEEFVDTVDWISPRPTSFRVNLKNGQDYILKWTGKTFEAQIMGKKYLLSRINDYQQALDKLALLYQEGPMSGAGESESEADTDFGGGGGGDFPGGEGGDTGEDPTPGDDTGDAGDADAGGEDLSGEPIDFEDGEEPEA